MASITGGTHQHTSDLSLYCSTLWHSKFTIHVECYHQPSPIQFPVPGCNRHTTEHLSLSTYYSRDRQGKLRLLQFSHTIHVECYHQPSPIQFPVPGCNRHTTEHLSLSTYCSRDRQGKLRLLQFSHFYQPP